MEEPTITTACPITPLGDRIVVRQNEAPEMIGKVYLPDSVREKELGFRGTVLAVGPGSRAEFTGNGIPMPDIQVGDEVVYSKYGGTEVEISDENYLVVRAIDVLGVIRR